MFLYFFLSSVVPKYFCFSSSLRLWLDDSAGEEGVLESVVELQLLVRPQHEDLLEELQGRSAQ